jgi:hypothetical protein
MRWLLGYGIGDAVGVRICPTAGSVSFPCAVGTAAPAGRVSAGAVVSSVRAEERVAFAVYKPTGYASVTGLVTP